MDPNTALSEIRELARDILDRQLEPGELASIANELASKLVDLDQWLNTGGFKPSDWA